MRDALTIDEARAAAIYGAATLDHDGKAASDERMKWFIEIVREHDEHEAVRLLADADVLGPYVGGGDYDTPVWRAENLVRRLREAMFAAVARDSLRRVNDAGLSAESVLADAGRAWIQMQLGQDIKDSGLGLARQVVAALVANGFDVRELSD